MRVDSPHRVAALTLIVLSLVLVAPSVFADDETEPTPAECYAAFVKTLPAPSDASAFEFKGTVVFGGSDAGEFHFTAKPAKDGERVVWELRDEMSMLGGQLHLQRVAFVGPDLDIIRGELSEKMPEVASVRRTFTRKDKSIAIVQQPEGGADVTETVEFDGLCTTGLSSLFLLARLGMPEGDEVRATLATQLFDPEIEDGKAHFAEGTITFKGMGTWNEKPAYLVSSTKGETKLIEIALDPESRAILGVRVSGPGQPTIELRPNAEEGGTGYFGERAKTATQCAMQALLGFAAADIDLLDRVIHWTTFYEAMPAEKQDEMSAEEFRAAKLAELKAHLSPQADRAMLEGMLPQMEGMVTVEEQEDGLVRVVFPEMFRGFQVVVGEDDGCWYLMQMPGEPK